MSDRNFDIKAWYTLTDIEKEVASRHMEVYAGFLAHTDEQIGRLMKGLKAQGKYENTLFVLVSDNGASSNGANDGVPMAHSKVSLDYTDDFAFTGTIGKVKMHLGDDVFKQSFCSFHVFKRRTIYNHELYCFLRL